MDAINVLSKYQIPTNLTVHHAIVTVGDVLDAASDFLHTANAIISELGGNSTSDPVRARLFAKALVEQAYNLRTDYDPAVAVPAAQAKVEQVCERLPFLFKSDNKKQSFKEAASEVQAKERSASDKRAKALAIWKANPQLGAGECAKLIAKELGITYSNAYYYTSRVFK